MDKNFVLFENRNLNYENLIMKNIMIKKLNLEFIIKS